MDEAIFGRKGSFGTVAQSCHGFFHGDYFIRDLGFDVARDVEVVVVGGNFVECDDACDAFDIGIIAYPAVNVLDVLCSELVLRAASFVFLRGIDDEHFVLAVLCFLLSENEDAGSQARAIEEHWTEADDGFK